MANIGTLRVKGSGIWVRQLFESSAKRALAAASKWLHDDSIGGKPIRMDLDVCKPSFDLVIEIRHIFIILLVIAKRKIL